MEKWEFGCIGMGLYLKLWPKNILHIDHLFLHAFGLQPLASSNPGLYFNLRGGWSFLSSFLEKGGSLLISRLESNLNLFSRKVLQLQLSLGLDLIFL